MPKENKRKEAHNHFIQNETAKFSKQYNFLKFSAE